MAKSVHHVNLSVPEDGAEAEGQWLVEMLGYRQVSGDAETIARAAAAGRTLWWFEADDGSQIHLSPNPEHVVVSRAHTAIRLGDEFDACLDRMTNAGHEVRAIQLPGDRRAFVSDPAGNLWELYDS